MRGGPLRHRVDFEERRETDDPLGGVVLSWLPVFSVWASIEPLTGREFRAGNQVLAEANTLIRVRWSAQVEQVPPTWRIVHGSDIYNIAHIAHVKQGRQMVEFLCKSGTNEG